MHGFQLPGAGLHLGPEDLVRLQMGPYTVEVINGGNVCRHYMGHGLLGFLGLENTPLPTHSLDALDAGPGEEGGRDSIGHMLEEVEGAISLVGMNVNEAVPRLKKELEVSEGVLGLHGLGSVLRLEGWGEF